MGLRTELRAIHVASKQQLWRRRLVRALRARNHPVGHKRVARLMAEERIQGRPKADSGPNPPAAHLSSPPNLLDRQFAPEPDRRRGSEISRMSPPPGMAASGRGHQRPDPAGAGLQRFQAPD
ncbi:IS3 family transposase [Stenotrophomonas maltophilia]|uniref:HTH-like domain-containing protein n=1 Tax=Stenotrophomonas maltophilia TaxID=40324 RepID=A0AAD0BVZ2_STEMA|nr:hypothetical protein SmaCSM2_15525 [Stenotrophomonas maltophilia]